MSPRSKSKNRPKRLSRRREVLQQGKPAPKSRPVREKSSHRSRIPDVYVGEVVNTRFGPKKKVFFRIGGKGFFRMVDPDWKAPGRPMKQRPKSKEQRLEKEGVGSEV